MAIKVRNLHKRSAAFVKAACFWTLGVCSVANTQYHVATAAVGAAGATFTLAKTWTRACQSVLVTPGGTPAGADIVIAIVGLNQFGEVVTENMTFSAATAAYTTYAYTKITSVTVVTQGGWTNPTIAIGYQAEFNGGSLPLLSYDCPAAGVVGVSGNIGTAALTFTVDTTKKTILIGTACSGAHTFTVMLDPTRMLNC